MATAPLTPAAACLPVPARRGHPPPSPHPAVHSAIPPTPLDSPAHMRAQSVHAIHHVSTPPVLSHPLYRGFCTRRTVNVLFPYMCGAGWAVTYRLLTTCIPLSLSLSRNVSPLSAYSRCFFRFFLSFLSFFSFFFSFFLSFFFLFFSFFSFDNPSFLSHP